MADGITKRVLSRIEEMGNDFFVAKDFWREGLYEPVSKVLNNLEKKGMITKVKKGIFCKEETAQELRKRYPLAIKKAMLAISRSFGWSIAPHGETALYMLGFDVPAPEVWGFVITGSTSEITLGDIPVKVFHRNTREISGISFTTGMLIQALIEIGKDGLDDRMKRKINSLLSKSDKALVKEESKVTIIWIHEMIKEICNMDNVGGAVQG
ncbi:MAG: DUF6088 family protein [Clostridiales bacterium]|nr:DUF6088 family protein [Clostridiales bacterium]